MYLLMTPISQIILYFTDVYGGIAKMSADVLTGTFVDDPHSFLVKYHHIRHVRN
jgi:hypothetical protein